MLLDRLRAVCADPVVRGRADLLRGELELRCGSASSASVTLLASAAAVQGTDRALAMAGLVRAGEVVCFTGDQHRYAEVGRRALALRRPDDPPAIEVMSCLIAGVAATLRGDHERAGPALRRAVVLGGRLTGWALTPTALSCAAAAGLLVAVDGAAHRLAERAVELARERGELSMLSRALELRAVAEYWLGRHEAAAETSRDGLRVARATGQVNCANVHLGMLAVLAAIRADRATSLRRIREIGESPTPGSRPHAFAAWALAVLDLVDGRHAEAADRLASLARIGTGRGQVLVQVMATPYLVEAAAHLAHRPAATAALAAFDRWASSTASPLRRALSARCHALLAPVAAPRRNGTSRRRCACTRRRPARSSGRAPNCSSVRSCAAVDVLATHARTCTRPARCSACSGWSDGPSRPPRSCGRLGSRSARRTCPRRGC